MRLQLPSEVEELREIDQESTFCVSFNIPSYPIYVTKIEPFVTEDTNHLILVGLEGHKQGYRVTTRFEIRVIVWDSKY